MKYLNAIIIGLFLVSFNWNCETGTIDLDPMNESMNQTQMGDNSSNDEMMDPGTGDSSNNPDTGNEPEASDPYNLDEVRAGALTSGKRILLQMDSATCPNCDYNKAYVFPNSDVQEILNNDYLIFAVDWNTRTNIYTHEQQVLNGPGMFNALDTQGYPRYHIYSSDWQKLDTLSGRTNASEMINFLAVE